MDNKCIINDLHLLVVFNENFLYPHFKFFQETDPKLKKSCSFLARHVTVWFYLMWEDRIQKENETEDIILFDNYKAFLCELDDN